MGQVILTGRGGKRKEIASTARMDSTPGRINSLGRATHWSKLALVWGLPSASPRSGGDTKAAGCCNRGSGTCGDGAKAGLGRVNKRCTCGWQLPEGAEAFWSHARCLGSVVHTNVPWSHRLQVLAPSHPSSPARLPYSRIG